MVDQSNRVELVGRWRGGRGRRWGGGGGGGGGGVRRLENGYDKGRRNSLFKS